MELNNTIEKEKSISEKLYEVFIQLLFPIVPHIASELWEKIGKTEPIDITHWPKADLEYLVADEIEIPIQVNGKIRDRLIVSSQISDAELEENAKGSEKVKQAIADKEIVKVIVISGKLVSIVIK
jgi:leucyl-tRNA synthetase